MKLRVLSNSELKTFRACQRLHHYEYDLLVRPVGDEAPLRFGDASHAGLEAWWREPSRPARWAAMSAAAEAKSADLDPFEAAKARALLAGYDARWLDEPIETITVEREFTVPLINPATGAASRTFVLSGKIDAIARLGDGRVVIVEHKTSSEDISPGSEYWRRLTLDTQISAYYLGARSLGFEVDGCLYDVLGKPGLRPLTATPLEERQYTKPKDKACPECKKKTAPPGPHIVEGLTCADGRIVTDAGGRLYANMREFDETPVEYAERCTNAIAAAPEKYFGRGLVVRLEDDEREAAHDVWQLARALREGELAQRFPRNPDACSRFNRTCAFFDCCTRTASIDDPLRFRRAERAHEELSEQLANHGSSKEESTAA